MPPLLLCTTASALPGHLTTYLPDGVVSPEVAEKQRGTLLGRQPRDDYGGLETREPQQKRQRTTMSAAIFGSGSTKTSVVNTGPQIFMEVEGHNLLLLHDDKMRTLGRVYKGSKCH